MRTIRQANAGVSLFKIMRIRHCSLLLLALAAIGRTAAAQTVDHYDMSRVGTRGADGQAVYPSGVIDPSRANPSQPPTDVAVPLPPQPDTPIRSVPPVYQPGYYGPAASSVNDA